MTPVLREAALPGGEEAVDREPQPQRRQEDVADRQERAERGGRPDHHRARRGGDRRVDVDPPDAAVQRGVTGAQPGQICATAATIATLANITWATSNG